MNFDLFFQRLASEQGELESGSEKDLEAASNIEASLFKQQINLIKDKSRHKAASPPRRVGKSWTAMAYAYTTCLRRAAAKVVIITLTLKSAKNIYWFEMLRFGRFYGIETEPYVNEMRIMFRNGSMIMLIGAESKAQIDKLRGGSYDLVIIDECKSFAPAVLIELIDDVIEPALADRLGTLLLIGTPGNILEGPFFEATYPGAADSEGRLISRSYYDTEKYWKENPNEEPQWSRHHWTQKDNVYVPHLWEEAVAKKKRRKWDDNNPTWLREHLGQWVPSEFAHVYSFSQLLRTDRERVTWKPNTVADGSPFGLPMCDSWRFILGLDLGFLDSTAAVIAAYNPFDGVLYHVWEHKSQHLDVDQVAALIARCHDLIPNNGFDAIVADMGGLGTQIIETYRRRYGWNIQAAEKREKYDYIELMNTDYHSGRIKIIAGSDLSIQKQTLQWDLSRGGKELLARTGRLKEHPHLPNDLCDAFLYIWRYSYHFWTEHRDPIYEPGSVGWQKKKQEAAMESLVRARDDEQNRGFWDELSRSGAGDPLKEIYEFEVR
jgi:hypothetical protein